MGYIALSMMAKDFYIVFIKHALELEPFCFHPLAWIGSIYKHVVNILLETMTSICITNITMAP